MQDAAITPNQHAIAGRWAFSDNFYADAETKAEAEIRLNGGYPDLVTESEILAPPYDQRGSPQATDLWDHLRRGGVTFQNFDDARATDISDQEQAGKFMAEIDRRYVKGGEPFPQFLYMRLPNDRPGEPDPRRGYPYDASFVEDNDFATGRIVDFLSHSAWWRDMAVFITENDTRGSLDHVDAASNAASRSRSVCEAELRFTHEFECSRIAADHL